MLLYKFFYLCGQKIRFWIRNWLFRPKPCSKGLMRMPNRRELKPVGKKCCALLRRSHWCVWLVTTRNKILSLEHCTIALGIFITTLLHGFGIMKLWCPNLEFFITLLWIARNKGQMKVTKAFWAVMSFTLLFILSNPYFTSLCQKCIRYWTQKQAWSFLNMAVFIA